jgi:hypothetical protein
VESVAEKKTEEPCCDAENEAEAPCCGEPAKKAVPGRCC